jgi:hypothetical protein
MAEETLCINQPVVAVLQTEVVEAEPLLVVHMQQVDQEDRE